MAPSSSSLHTTLTRNWLRRGPLACALWPVSLLFRALSALRYRLYLKGVFKSTRLPVPVVVVGNIFIGGTGKTPLTIWLVQALQRAGLHPGVISRGHGGEGSEARAVTTASLPRDVGDEPLLIVQRTGAPLMVGRDRAAAGRALLAAHPHVNVIVTDDGLQHYALQRDVEIILFDGRGAGNGWLLPAGPLREPPTRRRDFTVINAPHIDARLAASVGASMAAPVDASTAAPVGASVGASMAASVGAPAADQAPVQMTLVGEYAEQLIDRANRRTLAELNQPGLRIAAAAGIGNPARFFGMLKGAGLAITELPLPDHHDFLDRPFAHLDADLILMTEKDAVKCAQIEHLIDDPRLWVVPVAARIDGPLIDPILEKCHGRTTA